MQENDNNYGEWVGIITCIMHCCLFMKLTVTFQTLIGFLGLVIFIFGTFSAYVFFKYHYKTTIGKIQIICVLADMAITIYGLMGFPYAPCETIKYETPFTVEINQCYGPKDYKAVFMFEGKKFSCYISNENAEQKFFAYKHTLHLSIKKFSSNVYYIDSYKYVRK